MPSDRGNLPRKMAAIVHADVTGSTELVQLDEALAHQRINDAFNRFSQSIEDYGGTVHEIRGDALVAEFPRASDAVCAALAFQESHNQVLDQLKDKITPKIRIGVSLGEVIFADGQVTGGGVVLAQRVEQLAEPGGLSITGAVHEMLPHRLPVVQEDLGEQKVKGFDEPVRVYRVRLKEGSELPEPVVLSETKKTSAVQWMMVAAVVVLICGGGLLAWMQPWQPAFEPASVEKMALPLPDKPSIAVLPFTNMSDDKEQEYFADGMTEDLITDLSKISDLFVIARNSSFVYKDQSPDVRKVARDLGVKYVLEGSVRRVGEQVRINAQLIDAVSGGHIWAERYDGSLAEVFKLQDNVREKIVTSLALQLTPADRERIAQAETENIEAYDSFLQGWEHLQRHTSDEFSKALPYLKNAIDLDNSYSRAYAALAWLYYQASQRWWHKSLGLSNPQEALDQASTYLEKAMVQPTALAHRVAADKLWQIENKFEEAIAEAKRAVELDPGDPVSYAGMARALIHAGRPNEAIEAINTAMRLDPHYPPYYLFFLGLAHFTEGRLEESTEVFERALERNPEYIFPSLPLAAAYAHLGREQDALKALDIFRKVYPEGPTIQGLRKYWPFKRASDADRFFGGLRKAGVAESGSMMHGGVREYKRSLLM